MFEHFFQRSVDIIFVVLTSLIPTIDNIWNNNEEKTNEIKLTSKIESSENNTLLKRKIVHQIIPDLLEPRWIKIGKVVNLYIYPLISGKASNADECQITFDETYMFKKGHLITWDRSFVVYDKETKCIITTKQFPQLLKVELSVKDNYITLRTDNMSTLCVKLENKLFVKCSYSNSKKYRIFPIFTCTDCGDEVAEWLSRFLDDKASGLRLGYAMSFVNPLKMYWQTWNGHESLFLGHMWDGYSLGPFISISPCKKPAISQTSEESKNNKPETLEIWDSHGMVYPTIDVCISNEYLKRKWQWIKIGDLVIKISKPAIVKDSDRSFDEHVRLFGMGINCKLYQAGCIKLNDSVYAHFP